MGNVIQYPFGSKKWDVNCNSSSHKVKIFARFFKFYLYLQKLENMKYVFGVQKQLLLVFKSLGILFHY